MTRSALRVGLIVPRFAPFRGGMETYVAHAAAALARKGAEVTVITQVPRALGLPRGAVHDGYTVERHHLPVGDIFDVPSPSAARGASRSGRFDVLWVHNYYHTPLAWLAAERAQAPLVFTPYYHGVGHTPLRQALHRVYRPAGRRLTAASRRIVVDTDAQAGPGAAGLPPPGAAQKNHRGSAGGGRSGRGCRPYHGELPVVLTVARQEHTSAPTCSSARSPSCATERCRPGSSSSGTGPAWSPTGSSPLGSGPRMS